MIHILICWGGIRLQLPVRLQFISTLYTTRCVIAVLNKLSVTESLCLCLEEIPILLASSSEERLVGVLEGAWITPPLS